MIPLLMEQNQVIYFLKLNNIPKELRKMLKKQMYTTHIKDEQLKKLYDIAKAVAIPKKISKQLCSGGMGAAVLTKQGNIYTGVCIDTDCSLGMCAERNALSTMITNGEFEIDTVIAVSKDGKVCPPCGACREFMSQFNASDEIKIVVDDNQTAVLLKDLMPYPYL